MWHPERRIDFYISTTNYPGFKHKSFNLRLGRNCAVGGDVKEAKILSEKRMSEFKAANPAWTPSRNDPGPITVASHWIMPRSLEIELHVRYGKQLFAIRPMIQWNRKQRRDLRP